jgi:hypothetical protein
MFTFSVSLTETCFARYSAHPILALLTVPVDLEQRFTLYVEHVGAKSEKRAHRSGLATSGVSFRLAAAGVYPLPPSCPVPLRRR